MTERAKKRLSLSDVAAFLFVVIVDAVILGVLLQNFVGSR
jgi:hypothetical protein